MDKLIVIRHGETNVDGIILSEKGRQDIKNLAKRIKLEITGRNSQIFSSPEIRASQSAEIILEELYPSSAFITDDSLGDIDSWSYNENHKKRIFELISPFTSTKNIIIVSHLNTVKLFPPFFCEKVLDCIMDSVSLKQGCGLLIDCNKKTTTLFLHLLQPHYDNLPPEEETPF
jgi:phosphohistidine phosphatase SixA